jgi:UDP-N-acetylglucosamine 2-epimerase
MQNLKIATFVGTRPELIRLSRVLAVLSRDSDHYLIHTGQNFDYELNEIFFEDLGLPRPTKYLNAARNSPIHTIAAVLSGSDDALSELNPDAVLVLGDTNSGLAILSAKRRGIPTFHMEAGNRCFDPRVPEEINRRIIDHTADINLPYSHLARENLLREGLSPDQVIVTGSPMAEVLSYYRQAISESQIVEKFGLNRGEYFVASLHREENVDNPARFERFINIFRHVAQVHKMPVIVSTHPRTRKMLVRNETPEFAGVRFVDPLSFTDYVCLQMGSRAVLSDSGTICEEASMLGLRAINLRESHERAEATEEGSVITVGDDVNRVHRALRILDHQSKSESSTLRIPTDYQAVNVAEKVSRIIHSFTEFVMARNHRI